MFHPLGVFDHCSGASLFEFFRLKFLISRWDISYKISLCSVFLSRHVFLFCALGWAQHAKKAVIWRRRGKSTAANEIRKDPPVVPCRESVLGPHSSTKNEYGPVRSTLPPPYLGLLHWASSLGHFAVTQKNIFPHEASKSYSGFSQLIELTH